jgi:hypothetical protein
MLYTKKSCVSNSKGNKEMEKEKPIEYVDSRKEHITKKDQTIILDENGEQVKYRILLGTTNPNLFLVRIQNNDGNIPEGNQIFTFPREGEKKLTPHKGHRNFPVNHPYVTKFERWWETSESSFPIIDLIIGNKLIMLRKEEKEQYNRVFLHEILPHERKVPCNGHNCPQWVYATYRILGRNRNIPLCVWCTKEMIKEVSKYIKEKGL